MYSHNDSLERKISIFFFCCCRCFCQTKYYDDDDDDVKVVEPFFVDYMEQKR